VLGRLHHLAAGHHEIDPLADVTLLKRVDFVMARGEVVKAP